MAALSNVLQFPIQSIYPKISNVCANRDFFNKFFYPQYEPALFNKTLKLRILWSHTTNANLLGWSPNHFVPLIVVSPNANQRRSETSNTLVMKNDHFRRAIYQFYSKKQQKNDVDIRNLDSEWMDLSSQSDSESYCSDIAGTEIDIERDKQQKIVFVFKKISKESHKNEQKEKFADLKDNNEVKQEDRNQ